MRGQGDKGERPSAGTQVLKWLAPLLSGAVLGYLIVRVSTCEPEASSAKQPVEREPAAPHSQLDMAQMEGARMPERGDAGIDANAAKPLEPLEQLHVLMGDDLRFFGGSKSGFGGLGLRGAGRPSSDAAVPGLGDLGTTGTNGGQGEAFLGGSKSGTLDIGRIREGVGEERSP
jgi:hypothetical protein